jgi:Fasciclin domain.
MITKNIKHILLAGLLCCGAAAVTTSCVDNDDDVPQNYYQASKMTAAQFLEANSDRVGDFITLLKRTPYFSMLATYGSYTVFAPNNEAIGHYLAENGYSTLDEVPSEMCDTLARTHIIRLGAFFTTDIREGEFPDLNMDDRTITLSVDSDATNNNALIYYANKVSRLVEYDDSVTNGVVHFINRPLSRSSNMLPDLMETDSTLTLFTQALRLTGMADSLMRYQDESYTWGSDKKSLDSLYNGVLVRCVSGGRDWTDSYWPEKRYFKYTAFVEPDSVYHRHGIYSIEDLKKYAADIYDEVYPEDKAVDNPKDRRNSLNRFVSYHLMNRICLFNGICGSKQLREGCWLTNLADAEDYFETMLPHSIMRFCDPAAGLFINRKGLKDNYTIRGAKVLSPSESGMANQSAQNGVYYYVDDIISYSTQVREEVLNRRIRIDATTLSPDFMNCNARGRYGEDKLIGFRNNCISDWTVRGTDAYVGVHTDVDYWNSYQANAVCISGIFDVTFKLPPVPAGTYEIRLGYTVGQERGVVQFYLNNEPCGIPVDLRVYGSDPRIGWVEDSDDKDENTANDKAMRNHGYMKGMDSYKAGSGATTPLRANNWNLRRILDTRYLNENQDYYLRCRQVLEDRLCYWSFDFIELCPKSVYGSPTGEDTH